MSTIVPTIKATVQATIQATMSPGGGLPEPPTITIAMDPASVTEGEVLTFTATAEGSGTLTYQWNLGGVAIGGATANPYPRTTVLSDNGKVITCTVTDGAGQPVTSAGETMVVNAEIIPTSITVAAQGNGFVWGFSSDPGVVYGTFGSHTGPIWVPGLGRTVDYDVCYYRQNTLNNLFYFSWINSDLVGDTGFTTLTCTADGAVTVSTTRANRSSYNAGTGTFTWQDGEITDAWNDMFSVPGRVITITLT